MPAAQAGQEEKAKGVSATRTITEGAATVVVPERNQVFFNPAQVFNRDLSILAISAWRDLVDEAQGIDGAGQDGPESAHKHARPRILEAFGASGLRSIRYAKEIAHVGQVVCNDVDANAVQIMERNAVRNGLDATRFLANRGDAKQFMYQSPNTFDVIDLDPYGTAAPYMDAAIQSVSPGGLLCVTCTDTQVLAGARYADQCYARYGGVPLKSDASHELAIRLVLGALHGATARHGRAIVPLLSIFLDFYVRVFVQVNPVPRAARDAASNMMLVYQCTGCRSLETLRLAPPAAAPGQSPAAVTATVGSTCPECGRGYHLGGPMWSGALHDSRFLARLGTLASTTTLRTVPRIAGLVSLTAQELADAPLYLTQRALTGAVRAPSMPLRDLETALVNAGFRVSRTHVHPNAIKTDAPNRVLWDVMRAHAKRSVARQSAAAGPCGEPGSVVHALLSREITTPGGIEFAPRPQVESDGAVVADAAGAVPRGKVIRAAGGSAPGSRFPGPDVDGEELRRCDPSRDLANDP
ncbi:N2,N2-dimethylguanosine tRNA methyltransferase [Allomyces macrogynus ATCC 38327]|uniref:tRNA (guanine(26)-N(2))-dimethyltransferase n=1 Tax=Allomyces macrogynus (strain ATCC 38327) TaxID=578462 RepID=A0A0L0S290_ALLM3|nr:N2,N2-dimethylguanosine tRNA methyltransferase [Allomyces macrogynus ATCC 38327]|eukprot:KNE56673.1 N2,N2-dimethylguanosine tRNA methyltransferase [Allomyces macrogynus ATCC 38327]